MFERLFHFSAQFSRTIVGCDLPLLTFNSPFPPHFGGKLSKNTSFGREHASLPPDAKRMTAAAENRRTYLLDG